MKKTLIRRAATLGQIDERARTIQLSFASESPIRDFVAEPPVVLLHTAAAPDFTRLRSTAGVLMNHSASELVGSIVDVWVDTTERKSKATIRFDTTEPGELAFQRVLSGSLRGASVSAQPLEREYLERDETKAIDGRQFTGPLILVRRWQAVELSLTPVPADSGVGVGRMENFGMKKLTRILDKDGSPLPRDDDNGAEETISRQDVQQLATLKAKAGVSDEEFARWLNEGVTVERAREIALDHMAAQNRPLARSGFRFEVDAHDKWREACTNMLLRRANYSIEGEEHVAPPMTLLEICKESLRRAHIPVVGTVDAIIARAAQMSASDLPYVLENAVNKAISHTYNEIQPTWPRWCRKGNLPDFKTGSRVALSEAPDLELTRELEPVHEGVVTDSKESLQLSTYARRLGVSRQAIANDDLGLLEGTARAFAVAARRLPDDLLYTDLQLNSGNGPVMRDSVQLFNSGHANTFSGEAFGETSIDKCLTGIAKQTAPGGAYIGIEPGVVLVPPDLRLEGAKLLNSIWVPGKTAEERNVLADMNLELLTEPRLTSATRHYVTTRSGSGYEAYEVAFLDGSPMPTVRRLENTSVLGVEWVAYLDVAIKCLDWRPIAMHTGAA